MTVERRVVPLDDETIDRIAERVSDKIMEPLVVKVSERIEDKFFQSAGKLFVEKILYLFGVMVIGGLYWLNSHNLLKF
jgi:hypothetical protein